MKKILAMILAVLMVVSLFAGCTQSTSNPSGTSNPNPSDDSGNNPGGDDNGDTQDDTWYVDYENGVVHAGSMTLVAGTAEGGEVGYNVYTGISGKDYTDPEFYTYTTYTGGTTDMKWSTHTWETSDDSEVLGYISSPFYTFYLNDTADGWAIACEMAAALPEDVTSQYVGQYGIEEGDTLQAWKIVLREDLCWEDGTPITADDFIYSAQELLDPIMLNRRADSLYAGDFQIYGAKEYYYQGKTSWFASSSAYSEYTTDLDSSLIFSLAAPSTERNCECYMRTSMGFPSSYDAAACAAYLIGSYLDGTAFTAEAAAAMEGKTLAEIKADETLNAAWEALIGWWQTDPNEELHFFVTSVTYEDYDWEDVGFLKTGEYEITMIVTAPIENANYYVPYNLSGSYLVYKSMWEDCKTYWNSNNEEVSADSDEIAFITTTYCTSKETTMSYGPYVMDYFELDKQYSFARNEKWYGYSDGNHLGMYQTDAIKYTVISDHATALMAFESGDIMGVGLQRDDMEKYSSYENLMYTPTSYTWKLIFNTDVDALESHGTGSQVLANVNLRKALSLAIDRTTYTSSLTAGSQPGFGLLNGMYVYDPFTGASYRNHEAAKEAIVNLYGLTYGDDGEYGDLDEAYEAVTGYDPTLATELMAQAYAECVADGLYDGTSTITLEICVYNSDEIYIKIFNFFNDALKAAAVGTGFEGKIELTMKEDADYYNTMYSGNTDIIMGAWGGAAYSPYTMLDQVYCDASDGTGNQMEFGFDTSVYMVTIVMDGHAVTASLQDWAAWAGGQDVTITSEDGELTLDRFGTYDADTRAYAFSKLEYAYLSYYANTPLYYSSSCSVYSNKINYAVNEYIDLVSYGGLEFITYNYTDAEWAAMNG